MNIYCIRHAIAYPRGTAEYPGDDRPLTEEGIRKMKKNAKGIVRIVKQPDHIFTSPLKRALETANIVAREMNCENKITVTDSLLPDTDATLLRSILRKQPAGGSFILVGHEPHLSLFVSGLLGSATSVIDLKKGGMCRIDIDKVSINMRGRLIFHLTPKQLRLISSTKEHDRTKSASSSSVSRTAHHRRGH